MNGDKGDREDGATAYSSGLEVDDAAGSARELAEKLGHTLFTQDQGLLLEHALEIAASPNPGAVIQDYVQLVLSTRKPIEGDTDLDAKFVIAASNAISILNYGAACQVLDWNFGSVRDWSHCRIPYANLNLASLSGCSFEHADLSGTTLFAINTNFASFRNANLRGAVTYVSARIQIELSRGVQSVTFNPASDLLAVCSVTGGVGIYSVPTGKHMRTLETHHQAAIAAFSPDGQRLITGGWDATIKVWDAQTGACVRELRNHPDYIVCLAISPDGTQVATGARDGVIRIWDLEAYHVIYTLERHGSWVCCLAYSPDGTRLASGSLDKTVRVWDLSCGRRLFSLPTKSSSPPSRVTFSADGVYLATMLQQQIRQSSIDFLVWDVDTGSQQARNSGSLFGPDPDIRHVLENFRVNVWELAANVCVSSDFRITATAFCRTGCHFVSHSSYPDDQSGLQVWDASIASWLTTYYQHVATVAETAEFKTEAVFIRDHDGKVCACALSSDGRTLVTTIEGRGSRAMLYLWDAETGKCHGRFEATPHGPHSISFSRDGNNVIVACQEGVQLWDRHTRSCRASFGELRQRNQRLTSLSNCIAASMSPDGNEIAAVCHQNAVYKVYIFNVDTALMRTQLALSCSPDDDFIEPIDIEFSPDGRYIAVADARPLVTVWDVQRSELIEAIRRGQTKSGHIVEGKLGPRIAYNPQGTYLLIAGSDGTIRVWDMVLRKEKSILRGHVRPVASAVFLYDGSYVISASQDGSLRLWDTVTGECKSVFRSIDPIDYMALSDDNHTLVTVNSHCSLLRIWSVDVNALKDSHQLTLSLLRAIGTNKWVDLRGGDFTGALMDEGLSMQVDAAACKSLPDHHGDAAGAGSGRFHELCADHDGIDYDDEEVYEDDEDEDEDRQEDEDEFVFYDVPEDELKRELQEEDEDEDYVEEDFIFEEDDDEDLESSLDEDEEVAPNSIAMRENGKHES